MLLIDASLSRRRVRNTEARSQIPSCVRQPTFLRTEVRAPQRLFGALFELFVPELFQFAFEGPPVNSITLAFESFLLRQCRVQLIGLPFRRQSEKRTLGTQFTS